MAKNIIATPDAPAAIGTSIASLLIAAGADSTPDSAFLDTQTALALTLAGGDDYELAFTAPPAARAAVERAGAQAATRVTRIGRIEAAPGLRLVDGAGRAVEGDFRSFDHFA